MLRFLLRQVSSCYWCVYRSELTDWPVQVIKRPFIRDHIEMFTVCEYRESAQRMSARTVTKLPVSLPVDHIRYTALY